MRLSGIVCSRGAARLLTVLFYLQQFTPVLSFTSSPSEGRLTNHTVLYNEPDLRESLVAYDDTDEDYDYSLWDDEEPQMDAAPMEDSDSSTSKPNRSRKGRRKDRERKGSRDRTRERKKERPRERESTTVVRDQDEEGDDEDPIDEKTERPGRRRTSTDGGMATTRRSTRRRQKGRTEATEELPIQHPPITPTPSTFIHGVDVSLDPSYTPRPQADEERLLKILFDEYNPSARPVINSSKTVPVVLQFSLMHIKDLDVRSQILTTTGLLILEWTDERLQWQPHEHNNLTEIFLEAKGLWRPEFAVINGAEKIYEDYNQFRSVITSSGTIHWEPGGVFKTMCEIDITYYPFDEQKCEMQFGAWSYHTSKMNLTNSSSTINMDSYKVNGEWEIYETQVQRNEFFYECCPNERFANIAFVVYMRRRHTFYVLNVILPSIMTSVLLLSVFFCTPGQKVQIGVVVLLSFRIFLLNVAGNIPKTSDHIPLLGIYLTCIMAITTLSMVLTVFVLNLHHVSDKPVPPWAKKFVFLYLSRLLGMCSLSTQYLRETRSARSTPRTNHLYQRTSAILAAQEAEADERAAIMEMQTRPVNGTPEPKLTHVDCSKHKEDTEDYSKDWKTMAEVFDRLFFWLFLLAILISTLVLFHPLTNNFMRKFT